VSTLIIGGLFVVALIALVALVFVLRSEQRTSGKAPANAPTNATPDGAANSQPDELTTTNTNESSSPVASVPVPTAESRFAMGNGQFHEFSTELHTLHEQSQEIEHRLSILSEMIERIERTQDAHIAEEYSSFTDKQSVN
jgi:hypothetical protein